MKKMKCVPYTDRNWHTKKDMPIDGSLIQFGVASAAIVNPRNIVKVDFEEGNWKHQIIHWRYWYEEYANTVLNDNRMKL